VDVVVMLIIFIFIIARYVAAKTVYFGVGGGILPFCELVNKATDEDGDKFKIEKVFESDSTVKREILKVSWAL
jgi:protein-histidine N-methyltransferase